MFGGDVVGLLRALDRVAIMFLLIGRSIKLAALFFLGPRSFPAGRLSCFGHASPPVRRDAARGDTLPFTNPAPQGLLGAKPGAAVLLNCQPISMEAPPFPL